MKTFNDGTKATGTIRAYVYAGVRYIEIRCTTDVAMYKIYEADKYPGLDLAFDALVSLNVIEDAQK